MSGALTPDEIAALRYHVETKGITDVSETIGWHVEWIELALAGKPVEFVNDMRYLLRDHRVTPDMLQAWELEKSTPEEVKDAVWRRFGEEMASNLRKAID